MDKPLIRHCRNCKWCDDYWGNINKCWVRYTNIIYPRLRAIFCMYFDLKDIGEDE